MFNIEHIGLSLPHMYSIIHNKAIDHQIEDTRNRGYYLSIDHQIHRCTSMLSPIFMYLDYQVLGLSTLRVQPVL